MWVVGRSYKIIWKLNIGRDMPYQTWQYGIAHRFHAWFCYSGKFIAVHGTGCVYMTTMCLRITDSVIVFCRSRILQMTCKSTGQPFTARHQGSAMGRWLAISGSMRLVVNLCSPLQPEIKEQKKNLCLCIASLFTFPIVKCMCIYTHFLKVPNVHLVTSTVPTHKLT